MTLLLAWGELSPPLQCMAFSDSLEWKMSYIKWCLSIAFDSERRVFVTSLLTWHCIQRLGSYGNSSLSGTKRKMQDEGEYR